jgi:hypothetical protein
VAAVLNISCFASRRFAGCEGNQFFNSGIFWCVGVPAVVDH